MSESKIPDVKEEHAFFTNEQAVEMLNNIKKVFLSHPKQQHIQECNNPSELVRTIHDKVGEITEPFFGQPPLATKPIKDMVTDLCHDVPQDSKIPLGTGGSKPEGRGR